MLFRHAGKSGALIFDETKVDAVQFEPEASTVTIGTLQVTPDLPLGRPVSASWTKKSGESGSITFKYFVDASGRHGIISTKYLKNRKINENFKNVANWAYWKSDNLYGLGTHMEGSPYFEGLEGK